MHYQAVLLSDFYILIQLGNKVNWWDYLDLNQESTNYEFAALTNYAIAPKMATRTGLEPVTPSVTGLYSNQLCHCPNLGAP